MPSNAPAPATIPGEGQRARNKREKRLRLVAAARALFREQGFEATTTRQIARRAGVATGTLFLYFPGKEQLLVELFREDLEPVLDEAFGSVDHGDALLEQLLHVFDRVRERLEEDRELAAVFLKQLVFLTEDTRPEIVAFTGTFVRSIAELVEQAQEKGEIRPDIPPFLAATNLFAIHHIKTIAALSSFGARPRDEHAILRRALALQIDGLVPRDP